MHARLPLLCVLRCAQPRPVHLVLRAQLTKTSSPAAAGRDCRDHSRLTAWLAALSTSKELKINEARAFSNLIVPQLHKASISRPDKGVG